MCDCRETLEAKMRERIPQVVPEATNIDVELSGYVFILGKRLEHKPALKFRGSYMIPKKNGDGLKKVKVDEAMIANYCPFCGESLAEPDEDPAA